jgi:hypothetical protein
VTPDILDFAPGIYDVLAGDAPPSVDKDLVAQARRAVCSTGSIGGFVDV